MQHPIYNSFCDGMDSAQKILHLNQEVSDEMFHDSLLSPPDSDDSSTDEFNINVSNTSSQDFGLGYWINRTNPQVQSPLPSHKPDKAVFINKSTTSGSRTNDASLSSSSKLPKRSRKTSSTERLHSDSSQLKSTKIKYKNYDIPRLKIPKHVIKNYLKTLSPSNSSQSSSSESEPTYYSSQNNRDTIKRSNCRRHIFDSKSSSSSAQKDSSCLEKSFANSNNSNCPLLANSHDLMHLTLTIDQDIYSSLSKFPRERYESSQSSELDNYLLTGDNELPEVKWTENLSPRDISSSKSIKPLFYPKSRGESLSYACDIAYVEKKSSSECYREETQQRLSQNESACKQVNKTPTVVNNRKRTLDSVSENDQDEVVVSVKRRPLHSCLTNEVPEPTKESDEKTRSEMSPIGFLKLLIIRLKRYENMISEKYCLSQPNAMKFLAQNHATNWECSKNNLEQMHLVPCEFLNEIFHRALHCYGLEKKVLGETVDNGTSPTDKCNPSHSPEYKKIRDEYSFSLKRVRYGIGVIDELFRRKVNYQNFPQNNDVTIVRKWKHIIYYLCLHAKSAFMAKEIQYDYYVQYATNSFDGAMDLCLSNTPSVRCLSNLSQEMYNKPQLSKDSCKVNPKITPDHFSHSDLDLSPHSYDSGKGSSIHTFSSSSNANSLISGCLTTSSLNSTPHSIIQDHCTQLNLPGFQLFRIDEYQSTANDYIRLLPDAGQLHQRITAQIGTEPNANSRENMVKLIYYSDIVQSMLREDYFNECLQRFLGQISRT